MAQSLNKIENLRKRALRLLMNDHSSTYERSARKVWLSKYEYKEIGNTVIEISKALNKLNPGYMNDIFKLRNTDRRTRKRQKLDLEIPKPGQATFGERSLRSYGLKI